MKKLYVYRSPTSSVAWQAVLVNGDYQKQCKNKTGSPVLSEHQASELITKLEPLGYKVIRRQPPL